MSISGESQSELISDTVCVFCYSLPKRLYLQLFACPISELINLPSRYLAHKIISLNYLTCKHTPISDTRPVKVLAGTALAGGKLIHLAK